MDISPFLAQGSSHHLKENKTLCIKGKFSCFCCRLLTFSKINFQKIISEHYQSVKLFGSRSGPRKSCPGLGPNCCLGYLSRLEKSQLALIMKKLQELFIKHKYILVLKIMSAAYFQMNLRLSFFLSLYTARPSFEYYRQVYFVHSGLQDESLQVTISKLP